MTGVQTEYFLGLYFLVVSLSFSNANGKTTFSADTVRLLFAILFLVLAFFGLSFVK